MGRGYPGKTQVAEVFVYSNPRGFFYTCRNREGQIVYESPLPFRSRWDIRKQVKQRWPGAKVVFS